MVMQLDDFRQVLAQFDTQHPRPHFSVAEFFLSLENVHHDWPKLWQDEGLLRKHAEDACVYFMFDRDWTLQYIGQTTCLGRRFGKHFAKDGHGQSCVHLGLIPVPEDSWFEILAIEAFLIKELRPLKNKM